MAPGSGRSSFLDPALREWQLHEARAPRQRGLSRRTVPARRLRPGPQQALGATLNTVLGLAVLATGAGQALPMNHAGSTTVMVDIDPHWSTFSATRALDRRNGWACRLNTFPTFSATTLTPAPRKVRDPMLSRGMKPSFCWMQPGWFVAGICPMPKSTSGCLLEWAFTEPVASANRSRFPIQRQRQRRARTAQPTPARHHPTPSRHHPHRIHTSIC